MNRKLVIIILLGFFIFIPLILFGLYVTFWKSTDMPPVTNIIVKDKDTGEEVSFNSSKTPDTNGTTGVSILGAEQLYTSHVVSSQITFIRQQIDLYSTNNLGKKYKTITLVPQYYTDDRNGTISGKLRLGQGDDFVGFVFTVKNTGLTRVVIQDTGSKYGGNFDSGETNLSAD